MKNANPCLKETKMKKFYILMVTFGLFISARAQHENHEPCGYDQLMEHLETQYPGFRKQYDKDYLELLKPKVVESRKIRVLDTVYYYDTIYTLPVVFHVLWNTAAENLHDSLLYNQIDVLNRDFRRLNADTVNTREIFKSRAGDSRIQFELAAKDPNGNATTGINRVYTTKTTFYPSFTDMKTSSKGGVDAWDPQKYLNIWICDVSWNGQDALLGFAYPPYGHPFWTSQSWVSDPNQGVVLHYKIAGRNNPLANTGVLPNQKAGRVAVHEVGHFLGLRHTWGDGNSSNGCFVDDYIEDTPNQNVRSNFNCDLFSNTCTDPGSKQFPDMVENYMDYSSHSCQNMFTRQQIVAMRNSITEYRFALPSKTEIVQRTRYIDSIRYDEIKMFVTSGQRVMVELPNNRLKSGITADAYDMSGKVVIKDIALTKNENHVNTVKLAPGLYIFNLKDPENPSILKQKFFIQKN